MASVCEKCGNESDYNFSLNLGLCNSCIGKNYERMETALERIENWVQAYPLKVFPKPDLKKAAKVLKAAGMTLDAISADSMRHVLEGLKDIVEQARKGEDKDNGKEKTRKM